MKEVEHPQAHFRSLSSDEERTFINKIQSKKIPRSLFKYKDVEGALKFLDNSQLLYARPSLFNDPFDCAANVQTQHTSLEEWRGALCRRPIFYDAVVYFLRQTLVNPLFGQNMAQKNFDSSRDQYGILCLTTKNDNILMWSHYSNHHKGVCLEFDISLDSYSFYIPQKVIYSNKYPKINYIKCPHSEIRTLFQKSKQWKYEDEYRIIKPDGYGLSTIKKECLKTIIFGCKMAEDDKEKIRQKVKEKKFNVQFKKAEQDKESYKLNIVDA